MFRIVAYFSPLVFFKGLIDSRTPVAVFGSLIMQTQSRKVLHLVLKQLARRLCVFEGEECCLGCTPDPENGHNV